MATTTRNYKFLLPVIAFVFLTAVAVFLLPEKCSLLTNPFGPGPLECDAIPNNCCKDRRRTLYAQLIFVVSLGVTLGTSMYALSYRETE